MIVSEEYKATLQRYHEVNNAWGTGAHAYAQEILGFCGYGSTILDFGCGKGTLKKRLAPHPVEVYEYDPGIPGKDILPYEAVDYVISRDVLEHVEPECIDDVILTIAELAKKGVWLMIHTKPAGAILPDGRNAHLIQEGEKWWRGKLEKYFPGIDVCTVTGTWVKATYKKGD